jgi:hypothetical protein
MMTVLERMLMRSFVMGNIKYEIFISIRFSSVITVIQDENFFAHPKILGVYKIV